MKTILDRMGKIARQVSVVAEQSGRIVFCVNHSTALIKTYYAGLQPRFDALDRETGKHHMRLVIKVPIVIPSQTQYFLLSTDAHNKASVTLDVRKLSSVLNIHTMNWESSSICKSYESHLIKQ